MPLRRVLVENGWVEGTAANLPSTTIFKSIPYALPPVGELRWKEPQPMTDWEGTYKAYTFKSIPPLVLTKEGDMPYKEFCGFGSTETMSEDCLHLSIWTPAQRADEKLPVIFHIHGGGFSEGYSFATPFDGEAFAKQGVIMVSVEYRLGCLGFLAHPELTAESPHNVSGNYGLLDQIAALKWVRKNIAAFGGDPDNITVNGQSAGGISILSLICSPISKGDIAKAIIQSAGGYGNGKKLMLDLTFPTLAQFEAFGVEIVKKLGVLTIEEARKLPFEKILEMQGNIPGFAFWPNIDGYLFLNQIDEVIKNNEHANIPVIIGTTIEENAYLRDGTQRVSSEEFEKKSRDVFGKYADRYLDIIGFDEDIITAIDEGDMAESFPAMALAWCEHELTLKNRKPTYLYTFSRKLPGDGNGACHSADLWYTFNCLRSSWRPMETTDFTLANTMNGYWANFAKTGDPNGTGFPKWTPYTKASRKSIELGNDIKMIPYPGSARIKFVVDFLLDNLP